MSTGIGVFFGAEGFKVDAPEHVLDLSLPFHYDNLVDHGGQNPSWAPISMSRAIMDKLLWRIAELRLEVSVTEDPQVSIPFSYELGRSITDEVSLFTPGPDITLAADELETSYSGVAGCSFSGEQNIERENGDTFASSATFQGFNLRHEFDTRMAPAYVNLADLWWPHLQLAITISVNAGSDVLHTIHNYEPNALSNGAEEYKIGGHCNFVGFGSIPLLVYSDYADPNILQSISATLTPTRWLSWDGKWDTATGAKLR